MTLALAADLVMLVHFAFVIFVVLGGAAVWRWPRVAWLHAPAFVWGFTVTALGWICPLTPLEQELRLAAGEPGLSTSFIAHYIEPLLYPDGLNYASRMFFAVSLLMLNAALYWHAYYRRSGMQAARGE